MLINAVPVMQHDAEMEQQALRGRRLTFKFLDQCYLEIERRHRNA